MAHSATDLPTTSPARLKCSACCPGPSAQADGLLSVDFGSGLTQLGGPSQNGGDTLVWLSELLGLPERDIGAALDHLLAAPRHPQDLLFLPYLQGERVPYWDPSLRGAFIGLHRRHGPGDLARAALEGIAFVNRIVLERAEAAIGRSVARHPFRWRRVCQRCLVPDQG